MVRGKRREEKQIKGKTKKRKETEKRLGETERM